MTVWSDPSLVPALIRVAVKTDLFFSPIPIGFPFLDEKDGHKSLEIVQCGSFLAKVNGSPNEILNSVTLPRLI